MSFSNNLVCLTSCCCTRHFLAHVVDKTVADSLSVFLRRANSGGKPWSAKCLRCPTGSQMSLDAHVQTTELKPQWTQSMQPRAWLISPWRRHLVLACGELLCQPNAVVYFRMSSMAHSAPLNIVTEFRCLNISIQQCLKHLRVCETPHGIAVPTGDTSFDHGSWRSGRIYKVILDGSRYIWLGN